MTPAITLSVCYFAGLEQLTLPLVVSVSAIAAGTGEFWSHRLGFRQ